MNDNNKPSHDFRGYAHEVELLEREDSQLRELTARDDFGTRMNLDEYVASKAIANIGEMMERAERAFHFGCYIETMSLFVQHIELWLRFYRAAKLHRDTVYVPGDRTTFGQLISSCSGLGFEPTLVRLMRNFNTYRSRAIHAYILGHTDYEYLRVICARYSPLPAEVGRFTRENLGEDF